MVRDANGQSIAFLFARQFRRGTAGEGSDGRRGEPDRVNIARLPELLGRSETTPPKETPEPRGKRPGRSPQPACDFSNIDTENYSVIYNIVPVHKCTICATRILELRSGRSERRDNSVIDNVRYRT